MTDPTLRKRTKHRYDAIVLALLVVLYPAAAHAYIDPGSGALVLQAIIAGVVGAAFYFRDKILLIAEKLGLYRPKEIEEPAETPAEDSEDK